MALLISLFKKEDIRQWELPRQQKNLLNKWVLNYMQTNKRASLPLFLFEDRPRIRVMAFPRSYTDKKFGHDHFYLV